MKRTASSIEVARAGLKLALAVTACALVACTGQKDADKAATAKRPNVVYILADDMGYSDIGAFGGEIPTPNLDALAKNGMLLTNFYAAMSCAPTRAMVMSGMDNHQAGMGVQGAPRREEQKGQPGYEGHLNLRVAALPELLTDAGYNTYMVGKWHLGATPETGPHARGFKRVFASLDGAAHLGSWDWRGPQDARFFDQDEIVNVGADWYSVRDYTRKMTGFIEQDRAEGKPFFAWLAYTTPHWPLQAPKETIAKFKGKYDAGYEALYAQRFARQKELGLLPGDAKPIDNARFRPRWNELPEQEKRENARRMEIYAAMVSDLDTYVGEFVAYLKQIGEFDNTLIVFSSDNGAESSRLDLNAPYKDHIGKEYDHSFDNLGAGNTYVMYGANWASASMTPFNRHKGTGWEGGIHVPAFAHFPGRVKAGSQSDAVGTVMDILPTFLDAAGTTHPGTQFRGHEVLPPRGRSLLPVLLGKAQAVYTDADILGWEQGGPRSVRQGDWKLVWDQRLPPAQRRWQLFNLATDREEQHDLSATEPQKLAEMQAAWDRYDAEVGVVY
ncbi:MAG: arylsulfatase [Pseudomonadota bacterium]|nr:arylsulfatase [Pseudomonadota bacterium]